jgi:hypothetical protein
MVLWMKATDSSPPSTYNKVKEKQRGPFYANFGEAVEIATSLPIERGALTKHPNQPAFLFRKRPSFTK